MKEDQGLISGWRKYKCLFSGWGGDQGLFSGWREEQGLVSGWGWDHGLVSGWRKDQGLISGWGGDYNVGWERACINCLQGKIKLKFS